MTKRDARKKMSKAVGHLKTRCEHRFKNAHYYGATSYYCVDDICKALGVSIDQFFGSNLRKEIILFTSILELKE